jgi:hypothetical protein
MYTRFGRFMNWKKWMWRPVFIRTRFFRFYIVWECFTLPVLHLGIWKFDITILSAGHRGWFHSLRLGKWDKMFYVGWKEK